MTAKTRFYAVMVLAILALFGNAFIFTLVVDQRRNVELLKHFETLSYEQCAERYHELTKEFEVRPTTGRAYFTVLARAYALEGSARKAMHDNRAPGNFRASDIVRSIPVEIQQEISQYSNFLGPIADSAPDYREALRKFEASGSDPLRQPEVAIPGAEQVLFGWILLHFGAMPFVFVHFAIQLRARKLKVLHDVLGNPMFPFWLFFWEVGLFRYPMKVSPGEQLRRARRWATLVLGSALSCFAGTGKVCEEKPERAPQYQLYRGIWSRMSFTTVTLRKYIGLDGGNFFDAPVQQSTATVSLPCGFSVGVFYSEPLGDRNIRPNFGRELDPYVGWNRTFKQYTFDSSFTYLFVSPIRQVLRGDVIQLSERIARKVSLGDRNSISPYVWLRQATPVRGPTPIGGNFVHGGTTFSRTVNKRVSASVTTEIVRDSGAFGYRKGYIGRLVGGINWKGSRGFSFQIPQITFTDPISHTGDGRHREFCVGAGFSFSPGH